MSYSHFRIFFDRLENDYPSMMSKRQTSTAPETNNGNPSSAFETAVSSTSKPSNAF